VNHCLIPAGFLGTSDRQVSGQVDAALPGALGHAGKAADLLASVTCVNSGDGNSCCGWRDFL